ncbi:MAG: hypothetical protein IKG27_03515 [Bacilli bacterium]|nr:hypothetical protein [Bacilli bacterium]
MKYNEKLVNKFLAYITKEKSLTSVCKELDLNEYEVLGLVNYIKNKDINIALKKSTDDIYMIYMGDIEYHEKNTYDFETDENNEFKFIAISDTRLGSKSQQISILNDIYKIGHENGYNNVILCGNISAGLYRLTDLYAESNFINDTEGQINYIVNFFPEIEDMTTYFITGKIDDKHLKQEKISIGRRIAEKRDDMVFLGENSCDVNIDNVTMQVLGNKLGKTYTVSYRTQQQIDSFRSEDKPEILLYGGLLQMEKFTYRNVRCISTPSVCATTKEMTEKRFSNTIGAWYVTVKTNEKGLLESVTAISSPYYVTDKDDYIKARPLKKGKAKKLTKRGKK